MADAKRQREKRKKVRIKQSNVLEDNDSERKERREIS